jgi:GNAT superfamily N-acetyltransferase
MVDEIQRYARDLEIHRVHESESIRRLFGNRIERTVGPSYQGVCESRDFRAAESPHVRRLVAGDRSSLERFISDCPKEDRDESGVDPDSEPLFGFIVGEELAAVGGIIPWAPYAANPAVITHPEHRGKGYATPVVSAVMNHIFGEGKAVLYQTLLSNVPAVRIAEKLGCRLYATMTFVAFSDPR